MRYTLWLDGHLLGETRLEHRNPASGQRLGGIQPTAHGLEVLPGLSGFLVAAAAVKSCLQRHGVADPDADVERTMQVLESTPEGERFTALVSALARLELREAGGQRAPFHTVVVTDVRELEQLTESFDAEAARVRDRPRFMITASPLHVRALPFTLRGTARMRVRLDPN